MWNNGLFFSQGMYSDELKTIKDVAFTRREIDIIACVSNLRGTSKIASLLGILPSTVVTHIHHIMLKLECHSREGIVDFVEGSDKLALFKRYYLSLVVSAAFEKALEQVAKLKKEALPLPYIVYMPPYFREANLLHSLKRHLKRARVKAIICKQEEQKSPKSKLNNLENLKNPLLLLYFEPHNQEELKSSYSDFKTLDLRESQNYYFLVLTILTTLLPTVNFEHIISEFKVTYEDIKKSFDLLPSLQSKANHSSQQKKREEIPMTRRSQKNSYMTHWQHFKDRYCIAFLFFICCVGGSLFWIYDTKDSQITQETLIRSNLSLPKAPLLLNRPELLTQLDDKLKGADDIKVVAVIGVGGAGKTILARQYAHAQKAAVVWQLNAETRESLKASFEDLAKALAQTENEKNDLKILLRTEDLMEKEERVLEFVKESLRLKSDWILIYDNVEQYADIHKHLPQDVQAWGKGRVILTTRNHHFQNNPNVTHTVLIGELEPHQRLTLFAKIMSHGNEKAFTEAQTEQAKPFLEEVPPYPLDVSLAAHYINATQTGYEDYLEQLEKNNQYFENVQENILKESGDYTKTRQSIIALSLEKLIHKSQDFKDLLIFMSSLDSQNIPQELLRKFKESEIVDAFIYHLKKYSFISSEFLFDLQSIPMLSLHRSTQVMIRAYFMKDLSSDPKLLSSIAPSLEKYIAEVIDKQDLLKMQLILGHSEAFLNHSQGLPENVRQTLQIELGGIYFHIGFYHKAQKRLEENIAALQKRRPRNDASIARGLGYLGSVYRWLGDYEKSAKALQESLVLYQKQHPQDYDRIAWVYVLLGEVSRELAQYEKARDYFEKGLAIYKEHFSTNYIRIAWAHAHLGVILKDLGEHQKATDHLHESLAIYEKELSKNQARYAWAITHLGNVYQQLGDYQKAEALLEESLKTTRAQLPKTHVDIAWVLAHLGNVSRNMGHYEKAKTLLQESLAIYEKHVSENPARYAWAAVHLANIYRKLGYYKEAKNLLQNSLQTFKSRLAPNHDRTAWTLTLLGIIASEQGDHKAGKGLLEKSLQHYQATLPENHPSLAWVSSHLGIIYGRLGQHNEALRLLENSLLAYRKHYGRDHVKYAQLLREFGNAHLRAGHLNMAQDSIEQALEILNASSPVHCDIYKAYEDLSDLLYQKADAFHKRGELQATEIIKSQALQALIKAHEIVTVHFPKDSPHVQRIRSKLNAVKNKGEGQR